VLEGQRDVWIAPVDGAAAGRFTTSPASDIHPDWSPDGRQVVFVSDRNGANEIRVAPVRDGRPTVEGRGISGGGLLIDAPTWSPDSAAIAFVGQTGDQRDVFLVDAAGGSPPRRLTTGAGAWRVVWNRATGRLWASGFWGNQVLSLRILDAGSGAMTSPVPPVDLSADPASSDFDLTWDGLYVAFARYEPRGDLWIYQLPAGHSW
jgi:dipeptidyl aminopeptidase/acylaminoacyl peptidase